VREGPEWPYVRGGTTPSGKPFDLGERTFLFARRVMQIVRRIPRITENLVLIDQFADCGTSIGANISEADPSDSKKEQVKYLRISRRSARETRFWLRLIEAEVPSVGDLASDRDEVTQLVRILSALITKLSARPA